MDLADVDGDTALMLAADFEDVEVARVLVEAGADKDLANNTGLTALMQAARQGHVEVARLLLEAGAKKDLADSRGDTALLLSLSSSKLHVQVARLLAVGIC